jgi:hypothetical protein
MRVPYRLESLVLLILLEQTTEVGVRARLDGRDVHPPLIAK